MSNTTVIIGRQALDKALELVKQPDMNVIFHGIFCDGTTTDILEFMGHYYFIILGNDPNKSSIEEITKDRKDCIITELKNVGVDIQFGGF